MRNPVLMGLMVGILAIAAQPARAQWAVIDVNAIGQLVQEVATLRQQLQTAEQSLVQQESQVRAMTGSRGMQNLLSGTNRNYLPPDWTTLASLITQTSGAYQALSQGVQSLIVANAVLTPAQVAQLSPSEQADLNAARQSAALLEATSRAALANTSARFATLQQLIQAIPSATDQKGALDLQARIEAEQAMLENEHTKLQVLDESIAAQSLAHQQTVREEAIAGVGSLRSLPALALP